MLLTHTPNERFIDNIIAIDKDILLLLNPSQIPMMILPLKTMPMMTLLYNNCKQIHDRAPRVMLVLQKDSLHNSNNKEIHLGYFERNIKLLFVCCD